jgi:hypothetical protein
LLLAALCVAGVASLATATASAATQGFDIYNLAGSTLKLDDVFVSGLEPVFEKPASRPLKGDLLKPGQTMHIELNSRYSIVNNSNVREVSLDFTQFPPPKSSSGRKYSLYLATGNAATLPSDPSQVVMDCYSKTSQCPVDGTTATMLDPPGTTINIPATDAPAQATVLAQVCTKEPAATCEFNPTKTPEKTTQPREPISDPVINCSATQPVKVTEKTQHKVGTTNSVEVGEEFSVEVGLEAVLKVKSSVFAKYGHTWLDEYTFTKGIDADVEPREKLWVEHAAPVVRYTGDFTLTIGNTTFTLEGVYFDEPDPGRTGSFYVKREPVTPAELENCRHHEGLVRLPQSALTVARSGSAGSNTIRGGLESDVLRGLGGSDIISGGSGNDTLFGGAGDDLLLGGSGRDVLDGGPGADTIIDTRGAALVRTGTKTGRGWDDVYVRDGRAADTVMCGSRHTIVVADKGDRVHGRCGVVIRRGPVRQPIP